MNDCVLIDGGEYKQKSTSSENQLQVNFTCNQLINLPQLSLKTFSFAGRTSNGNRNRTDPQRLNYRHFMKSSFYIFELQFEKKSLDIGENSDKYIESLIKLLEIGKVLDLDVKNYDWQLKIFFSI